MKHWISTALLCLSFTTAAFAESEATKTRQQLFTDIEEQTETLEDLMDDEQWQQAAPLAGQIADKALLLNDQFPENSQGEGRSRDGVWEEWAKFSAKLQSLESDYRQVSSAIQAGNHSKAEDALDDATSSCRSCHMSYRSLW